MAGGRVLLLAGVVPLVLLLSDSTRAGGISTEAARGAIDSCVGRLNPDTDIGYERIAARCPDLARRLDETGLSAWLPRDWKRTGNDLSSGGLRELGNLLALEDRDSAALPARVHQPDVSHLPAVLAGLAGAAAAEGHGWWARTKAWLRDVFERREEEDDSWFSRVVGQNGLSQVVIELISYIALGLVVVLALVIVANELRAVLQRSAVLTWDELHKVAPAQQPRTLLEIIASRLTEEGLLPPSRGLTVCELTRLAHLPDEADRRRLMELGRMCERMRFSDEPVPAPTVEAVLEDGRLLFERISRGTDGLKA